MAYAFQMSGTNPIGVWRGGSTVPTGTLECTEAQAAEFTASTAYFSGTKTPRWTYVSGVLAEETDSRITGTWSDPGGYGTTVDGDVSFDLTVGDVASITVTLSVAATGTRLVEFNGSPVSVTVASGVGTITIDTDEARKDVFTYADAMNLLNTFSVRVNAVKL